MIRGDCRLAAATLSIEKILKKLGSELHRFIIINATMMSVLRGQTSNVVKHVNASTGVCAAYDGIICNPIEIGFP